MNFVNVSKTISTIDDEDVWLGIQFYRNVKHIEEVMKAMESDKRANELYEESMELIAPGPIVFGDFIYSESDILNILIMTLSN